MKGFLFFIFLTLLQQTLGIYGTTLYTPITPSNIQCLSRNNITYSIVRAINMDGLVDSNALNTLHVLQQLNYPTDIYMMSCRGIDPVTQVNNMMDGLPSNLYKDVWIALITFTSTPGCNWKNYNPDTNCQYLKQLMAAVENRGKNVGIYSSYETWVSVFKSSTACPNFSQKPLWYSNMSNVPNFSDFKSFGAFNVPKLKLFYSQYNYCGIDQNGFLYHP